MDWIFIFLPMCLFYSLYISASTLSWVQSTFNNSWKKYILRLNIKYILKRLNLKHILDVYILMWPQVSSICPLSSNEDLEWCFPASGGTTLYVCELWRPGSCYGLRPTLIQMSADIKSWKIFLIWQSSRNSNVDIVLFCSKYGDSWQRFLLEVNNNTHTCELLLLRHGGPVECGHQGHQQLPRAPQSLHWQLGVQIVLQIHHQSTYSLICPDFCQVSIICYIAKFKLRSCKLLNTSIKLRNEIPFSRQLFGSPIQCDSGAVILYHVMCTQFSVILILSRPLTPWKRMF